MWIFRDSKCAFVPLSLTHWLFCSFHKCVWTLRTHSAPALPWELESQEGGGCRVGAVPVHTRRQRACKEEGSAWGRPLGPQKAKLKKEGAMGRDEGVFFLGSILYPHWSSPLTAHPCFRCKRGSEQNCAPCSPGSAVAQLGMRTTGGSGILGYQGQTSSSHELSFQPNVRPCRVPWQHCLVMWG